MTETQENQERSVPKPHFTDAEAGAKTFPDSTKRDFNYYTPAKRKQTRYEDVTVEVQPDPRHYLAQGWLYGFSDGRGGYPLDWTALKAWGSDRPEPESVVPAFTRLVTQRLPSGRYRAAHLMPTAR